MTYRRFASAALKLKRKGSGPSCIAFWRWLGESGKTLMIFVSASYHQTSLPLHTSRVVIADRAVLVHLP